MHGQQLENYTAAIKDWFTSQAFEIKKNHRFDSVKPFSGKGFSILILPQREFINYFPLGRKEKMSNLNALSPWTLLNCNNKKNGYVYKNLVDSLAIQLIIPPQAYIASKQNRLDTFQAAIAFYPVVFLGKFKKLSFEVYTKKKLKYNVSLLSKKDSVFFDAGIFGRESFYDSATATQSEYFFVPRKLKQAKYEAYCESIKTGGLPDIVFANKPVRRLQPDVYYKINIESTPTGCRIYRIGLDDYDLNPAVFDELKRNNYYITASFSAFLKPEFFVTSGGTNTADSVREITYIYFIRNGNKLSEPLICHPGPRSNTIRWDFTKF